VALPYHLGVAFEDVGVVTAAAFRGRGLSPACAGHVVCDVRARGRTPTWSTSPDNLPSLAVARKLGARKDRNDVLWVTGTEPPPAIRKDLGGRR
jgi:RimJ/RimL family protein N-acetyltransferase